MLRRPLTKSMKAMRLFISVRGVMTDQVSHLEANLGARNSYLGQSRSASYSSEAWDMT